MNCLRSCLLGCLVLVSSSTAAAETKLPAKKDFHLYLLVGQSNMAGRGKVAEADKRLSSEEANELRTGRVRMNNFS